MLKNPYLRYLLPITLFILMGLMMAPIERTPEYASEFAVRAIIVFAVFCFLFRGHWREIEGKFDIKAVGVGLLVSAVWLGHYLIFRPEENTSFLPSQVGEYYNSQALMWCWIVVRLFSAAIVTPLIEETVFRSLIPRFLMKNDFLNVPLKHYSHLAFWGAVVAFMCVHHMWQWPVAAFAGVAYGYYVVRTGNLWGAIIAHGVTNLSLGIYALSANDWGALS